MKMIWTTDHVSNRPRRRHRRKYIKYSIPQQDHVKQQLSNSYD